MKQINLRRNPACFYQFFDVAKPTCINVFSNLAYQCIAKGFLKTCPCHRTEDQNELDAETIHIDNTNARFDRGNKTFYDCSKTVQRDGQLNIQSHQPKQTIRVEPHQSSSCVSEIREKKIEKTDGCHQEWGPDWTVWKIQLNARSCCCCCCCFRVKRRLRRGWISEKRNTKRR